MLSLVKITMKNGDIMYYEERNVNWLLIAIAENTGAIKQWEKITVDKLENNMKAF